MNPDYSHDGRTGGECCGGFHTGTGALPERDQFHRGVKRRAIEPHLGANRRNQRALKRPHPAGEFELSNGRDSVNDLFVSRSQEAFGVNGRGAAHAGGGDGLAIDVVRAIAGDEDTPHIGHGAAFPKDKAVGVHFDLAFEDAGIGRMADGDEHAGAGQNAFRIGLGIFQANAGNGIFLLT